MVNAWQVLLNHGKLLGKATNSTINLPAISWQPRRFVPKSDERKNDQCGCFWFLISTLIVRGSR
eukprot:scaffold479768_cov20-Prasinocladus_malaysianus.AAC.1